MSEWDYISFDFSGGMSTNTINPGTKFAKRLLNVHNHQEPGKLKLRPGYQLKYSPPSSNMLTNYGFLNFDLFYDRQAKAEGQEITCLIQKATLSPLQQNMLCFWIRPYWNGTTWVDEWKWLNQTFITVIDVGLNETYPNMLNLYADTTLKASELWEDDSLVGYTVYNKTKNQFAKIITSKIDEDNIRICHTLYDNEWDVGDTVYIGRNWLDLTYHEELFENLKWQDIVFHRINNDLRIGFGGYENRPGLSVGYRKKYFALSDIDFTNLHSDLDPEETGSINAAVLEIFSTIDEVILDTAILDNNAYGIELTTQAGTMDAGTYYFRLTGYTDDFNEQLIAEASIDVDGTEDILIRPYIKTGLENPRLTKLVLYMSIDGGEVFYKLREDAAAFDSYQAINNSIVESTGRWFTGKSSYQGSGDYHQDANAASVVNEGNTIGGWSNLGDELTTLVPNDGPEISPDDGSYYLEWEGDAGIYTRMKIKSPLLTNSKRKVSISFSMLTRPIVGSTETSFTIRVSSEGQYPNPFSEDDYKDITHTYSENWQTHTLELELDGHLVFQPHFELKNIRIYIDKLQVTNAAVDTELGTEMKSEMGYNPTNDLVKGWDQVIIDRGRAYYLNPYVEKRYENFILVSSIHSSRAYMYDIASFSNYRELQSNDFGVYDKPMGMTLLPTHEMLILKYNSITVLSDDGVSGILRNPVYGVGCISIHSIVNMGGVILWCGGEDVYKLSGGLTPEPLLKTTIRDLYRDLSDKESIFCVRDKHNSYRLRTFNSTIKTEYLFTENGWIEESKWDFPEVYRAGFQNKLFFLSNGKIYQEEGELDYSATSEIIMSDVLVTDEE